MLAFGDAHNASCCMSISLLYLTDVANKLCALQHNWSSVNYPSEVLLSQLRQAVSAKRLSIRCMVDYLGVSQLSEISSPATCNASGQLWFEQISIQALEHKAVCHVAGNDQLAQGCRSVVHVQWASSLWIRDSHNTPEHQQALQHHILQYASTCHLTIAACTALALPTPHGKMSCVIIERNLHFCLPGIPAWYRKLCVSISSLTSIS